MVLTPLRTFPTTFCKRSAPAEGALTQIQRAFAASHHDLIYTFLRDQGWEAGEYYDIAAFGYLAAVRRYLTRPDLQKYAFSTIAWRSMKQSVAAFHKSELRQRDTERRYLEAAPPAPDPMAETEARLILHELASVSTPEQRRLAVLRLQGYTIAETARLRGMPPKRVSKLLREMYRVYLQLYKG